jgi:hypothetical protein
VGSTSALTCYLLLRHSYTWKKTSIFWSCQVFGAIVGEVISCINYNIYFIFTFLLSSFYFYHCLIFTLILHLKVLFNSPPPPPPPPSLLLFIIYIVNLPMVRPQSCRVIYYFDTPTLGRRHQSFGRVIRLLKNSLLNLVRKMMSHSLKVRKGFAKNINFLASGFLPAH